MQMALSFILKYIKNKIIRVNAFSYITLNRCEENRTTVSYLKIYLMAKYIILLLLISSVNSLFSQNNVENINGYYYSDDEWFGDIIQITNDSLFIYNEQDFYLKDSLYRKLAICHIDKYNDELYELNSVDGSEVSALKDIRITADTLRSPNYYSNITFRFDLPNVSKKLLISSFIKGNETICDSIIGGKATITLNKESIAWLSSYIPFYIYPVQYYPDNLWGQYLGVTEYKIYPFADGLDIGYVSDMTIHIPNFTDLTLEQFLIKGEYIRIDKDVLIWRTSRFKKYSYEDLINKIDAKYVIH